MAVSISQLYGATPNSPASNQYYGPLASLYHNKYSYNSLQYPRDLGSTYKGHMVKFDIYEVKPVTIEDVNNFVANAANNALAAVTSAAASTTNVISAGTGVLTTLYTGSVTAGVTAAGAVMLYDSIQQKGVQGTLNSVGQSFATSLNSITGAVEQFTQNSIQISPPTDGSVKASISLYMPETVNFSYNPSYTDLSIADVAGSSPLTGTIAKAVTSVVQDPLVRLGLNTAGYVFNPQQQLMFQGIDFRTYQMSFTFTPFSAQEAENVKEIIKTFRKFAAPTIVTGSAGFFFNPPGMIDVSFLFNGQKNPNINYIKRSVIENVEVNYAPNGWSAHEDGAPVQTTLTLSFKEMYLVDRTAIEQGY